MKSYLSSQLEVRSALSGELSRLFVPVKPMAGRQSEWLTVDLISKSPRLAIGRSHEGDGYGDLGAQMDHPKGGPLGWVRCPYPPESLIYFREAWCWAPNGHLEWMPKFDYRASVTNQYLEEWPGCWQSPATMPQAAARIYATLGEPTVELVDGIWKWAYPVTVVSTTGKP